MKMIYIFIVSLFLFMNSAVAQDLVTGTPRFGSLQSDGFDTINLQDLNVNFSIPIVSIPGRGRDFSFAIVNDSLLWQQVTVGSTTSWQSVADPSGTPLWGWTKDTPGGHVSYTHTQTWQKCPPPNGDWEMELVDTYNRYTYLDVTGTPHYFPVSQVYKACTGEFTGTSTGYATDSSGYYIDISNPDHAVVISPGGLKSPSGSSTDSNGNLISKVVINGSENDWKDTVGHTALKIITGSTSIQYQYQDPTGAYQTATLNLQNISIGTNFQCSGVGEYTGTVSLPVSLVLPNGKSYTFTYEPTPGRSGYYTGRVQKVTLPTGGYYQFNYPGANDSTNCADGSVTSVNRVVNDGTTSSTWQFSRSGISGAAGTTKIVAPILSYDSVANETTVTFNSSGVETSRKVYQGAATGNPRRTVNTTWASNQTPSTQITILDDQSTQAETYTNYDNYGNLLQQSDYDWGTGSPGSVLKTTLYTYLNTSPYTSRNIVNRLSSIVVKDGNGNIKARQNLAYDESGYINAPCPTGAAQHDDTNYGSTLIYRGNPTTITAYTDPVTPSGGIVKHQYFDCFGNAVKRDGAGWVQQTWAYSTTTQYAYPDSTTLGAAAPTLTTSATYNAYTGQTATTTDANQKSTTYSYYSVMNRLQKVTRSDLAHVDYSYDDTARKVTVLSPLDGTSPQTASQTQQITLYDGLGRPIQQQNLDTSATVVSVVDTLYDQLGRVYKVSNPRASGGQQYFTESRYDALGRPTMVIPPDGTATSNRTTYAYSTKSVTITDPAGNLRRTFIDGLGRLSQVDEPTPGPTLSNPLSTIYSYNVFDMLASVTQGVQTRSFVYDALGRLITETNPENSQTCYGILQSGLCVNGYDNHGNLLKRTDARGVVTTYTYDGLDRLHQTDYAVVSGVPATTSTVLTYGTTVASNNNGRLISMTDGTGSEGYTYNSLGQLTQLSKTVGTQTYNIGYAYNVAGEVKTITYPSGRAVDQVYDTAGRVSQIKNGTTNYANNFGYNAAGQVTAFDYGNAIHTDVGFNNRMQMSSLTYKNAGTTIFGLSYDYGYGVNNSGQIRKITDTVQPGRTITYTYDELMRVSSAVTNGSTAYPQWGLSFTYDRYGNRTAQNRTAGTAPNPLTPTDAATNHLSGKSYDLSGNVTLDSSVAFKYDAENRLVDYGGGGATYGFDGNGLRVKRTYGSTTVYIFSGTQVIAEYALNSAPASPTREYIYSGSLLAKLEGGNTTYYYPDHLSTRMTKTGGTTAEQGDFPFGETWYGSPDKWQFTSYERDSESSNDYALLRTFVNRYGRFLTPDPAGMAAVNSVNPQTWNRYAYVANNPTGAVDPLGLMMSVGCTPFTCIEGGGGGDYTESGYCPPEYAYCGDDPFGGGIPIGGDGGGGGGSNPSSESHQSRHIGGSFPNGETLGIPTGLPLNPGSIWSVFLPIGTQCEFGPCVPIRSGWTTTADGTVVGSYPWEILCQPGEPCMMWDQFNSLWTTPVMSRSNRYTYNPYNVPGTQCSNGCHGEPFTPHGDQNLCKDLALFGFSVGTAAVPGVEGWAAWTAYGVSTASGAYGIWGCP